jgi:hypothetical protein
MGERRVWPKMPFGIAFVCLVFVGVVEQGRAAGCVPPPAGIVSWWRAEGNGADDLGVSSTTNLVGVSFAAGEVGQAFVFNGTNSYVQIPDSPALSPHAGPSGELTLEAWVNLPRLPQFDTGTAQGNRAIVVKGGAGQWEYGFYVTTNATPVFGVWQNNGNGYASAYNPTITTNAWHHLAGVLRKGQFARLYIDGVLVSESTSFSGDTYDAGSPLYIGRRGDGQYLDGLVDEVAVYGRALSSAEIATLYAAGSSGKCSGVITGAGVPYQTNFENGAGAEWTLSATDNSESILYSHFLGRFGNGGTMLTLTNLVPGQSYTLGFDFYPIDSWDGGTSDYFNVGVNGSQLFHYSFINYSGSQSYPYSPDEGRDYLGFTQGYADSIYRNVEVSFTASNALTEIMFYGQNLEALDNESWGIDNLSVRPSSELTNTYVRSSTLPASGTTNYLAIETFTIAANWPLLATSATNAANYSLLLPGADGVFGTSDDVAIPMAVSSPGAGGRSVAFAVAGAPLQPGHYQFKAAGLLGTNGVGLTNFVRDFYVANPVFGVIEGATNNSIATATGITLTESPASSGFFSAFGVGTFSGAGDVHYWRFDAEAGDVVTVRLEAESQSVYSHIRIRNSSDSDLSGAYSDAYNNVELQNYTISTPGTYYVRVWNDNYRARYGLRLTVSRPPSGPQTESEGNDTQAAANLVNLAFSAGLAQGRIAGSLPATDTSGDYLKLGVLNPGNAINVTALYPASSTLTGAQTILSVQLDGNSVALLTNQTGNLNYTVVSNGVHYIRVESNNRSLRAQYLLSVSISDGVPPQITGTSLPAEGAATNAIVDRFTLNFSEDLYALSVSNNASYELRGAGADGVYGTADDTFYSVVTTGYTGGLTSGYSITDGPLQTGNYRLTVSTNLIDRAGNHMAAAFVRNFSVTNLSGYVLEGRNNDSAGLATPMSLTPGTASDGTMSWVQNVGTPSVPRFIAKGKFNGDTNVDLVTANWSADSMSFYTNTGKGLFVAATNFPTGNGAISLAVADLNSDGLDDVVVANYYAGTVSVLLSSGSGVYSLKTNVTGFSNPFDIALADVSGDGKPDLLVPNSGSGNLSVLLGNGDGTFTLSSNYSTGSYAMSVAAGDLNGDGKLDLAVANYNSSTVSVLTNLGAGTFALSTNLPSGPNPRYVAISDVTGDSVPDLVVLQPGDNSIAVIAGNGNGLFQPRRSFVTGTTDAYQFQLADLNGDGKKDIVIAGYGNNQMPVLLNNGTGMFTNLYAYGVSQNPMSVAVGDFNGDGRVDAAFTHYNGDYLSVWYGNALNLVPEDPPGSGLRTVVARGIRSSSGDVDYYQFTGNAGDQAIVSVDVPGNPTASSLNFALQYWDGGNLTSFNASGSGWGQSGVVTLPATGSYFVRVASNNDYQGEYRVRVTLARPPLQLEGEDNGSINTANSPGLARTNNHLQAIVAGYLSVGDGGDYYSLGYLLGGSSVRLSVKEPSTSGVAEILSIYNAAGTLMTNSSAGVTNFSFTVPAGQGGVYYAQVTAGSGGFTSSSDAVVSFSGGSDYISMGSTWMTNQVFSISMWLRPGASQNQYADILDNNHVGGISWVIEQNYTTNNQYTWGPGDGSGGVMFNLAANTWQHLAITRDSTNINRVYINGVLVGTAAGSGQINYNGNQALYLGRWGGGTGRGWNGMVDEVRIWNRALTAGEVAANMSGSLTGSEPGLIGYWPFSEGTGISSADLSPSNHVATLVNGPAWVQLGPTNAASQGLMAQYLLSFDLTNSTAPQVTSVTLPANGSVSTNMISAFTVAFSEDMDAAFNALTNPVYRYNGHSYRLTDSSLTWMDAEAAAVAQGGHLAAITNAAEASWLGQTFNTSGALWIGLNCWAGREYFSWSSGDSLGYVNWSGSDPNNSAGRELAVRMTGNGNSSWYDYTPYSAVRGIVEVVSAADADGDGLVDSLDPYPTDAKNAFDLRAAGPDGAFDTGDDVVYRIYSTGYSSGLSSGFSIADGPLQPGTYRFMATTGLKDRFGVALASPFTQYFTNVNVPGFIVENRRNGGSSSTSLGLSTNNVNDGSFALSSGVGVGNNPYAIVKGDFNQDGYLDLATANYGSGSVTVLTNDRTGHFVAATNISTGSGALGLAVGNFNADTNLDLAVANYSASTVSILLGDGKSGFSLATNITGFSNPYSLAAGDLNKDGVTDLVVPSYGNSRVITLFGTGTGGFTNALSYTVGSNPEAVALADLNGDGNLDVAAVNYSSTSMTVLLGAASGVLTSFTNYTTSSNPRGVALADVNGDGKADALVVNGGSYLNVFFGNGDGTFQTRQDYNIGTSDTYQVLPADLNNDGKLDLVIPGYGQGYLTTLLNNGDGTFGGQFNYSPGNNPIWAAVGDFNKDGAMDIATANYYGANVWVFFGNPVQVLQNDPSGTGLKIAAGRGNLADGDDYGYWTFSAVMGDRVFIATENPGDPNATELLYRIYYPNGSQWTYFYTDYNGRGNISLTAPISGTYTIRVEQYHSYTGEYRLRVALAKPPVQLESEDNSSIANANAVAYQLTNGQRTATFLGYIGNYDTSGDYFALGNLAGGTQITLSPSRPANSLLAPVLEIYNASGVLMASGRPGLSNLVFTTGATNGGAYYAHVASTYASAQTAVTNALYFDGSSGYVNLGAWAPGTNWSLEAWVMPASLPSGRRAILGSEANYRDWSLALYNGYLSANVMKNGGAVQYMAPTQAVPGTWYHVVATSDGVNVVLYVNGTPVASGPIDPNYAPNASGTWIGDAICCSEYFPGAVSEASVWNRTLTSAEVAGFYTNSPVGIESGLMGLWKLQSGSGVTAADLSTNGHNGTLVNGASWLALAPAGSLKSGILQEYLLGINLLNTIPPQVVAVSLPAEGTNSSGIWDRFSITFSEDMAPGSVSNSANYELRSAGLDNVFGTSDDQFYPVVNSPAYASGTGASYLVPSGPLQPGKYRFTVSTNVTDPVGTLLPTPYVRNFSITNVSGFVFENRGDNSWGLATTLSPYRTNLADGAFTGGGSLALGSGVERIAAGQLTGDTNMDLVAALWGANAVAILTGNGDGTFTAKTNYATGTQAWSVALGKFNTDTNLDLAVVNYGSGTVSILLGRGDGTFQSSSNYTVGSHPYHIVVADLNNDGKQDLVVPNAASGNVSVLLGNGDGTFQGAVNYTTAATPVYAAVGDVDGDGKPDLLVANYDANNVSLLRGNGDGTFAAPAVLPAGLNPRAVALADLNKDGKLDLAVFNGGNDTISIMLGNGNGTFQSRVNYAAGTSDGYELMVADFDRDGWPDLIVPGYNNNTICILRNRGDGTFPAVASYSFGNRPVGLALADFNNDGRLDIAVGNDSGNYVNVLLGNDSQPLTMDSATGLRIAAGRGNLYDGSQSDYWSFDAQAGDVLAFGCEIPGNPSGTGLNYVFYRPDGSTLKDYTSDYYGRGAFSTTCPVAGTYMLRVSPSYTYTGEYRFRVTLARPPMQAESEGNDGTGSADALSWDLSSGHRQASVMGYIGTGDGGDFYQLGYLAAGATIGIGFKQPASSGLAGGMSIYNSAGTIVSYSPVRATNLSFTVPVGGDGAYYAQVWDASPVSALSFGSGSNSALKFWGSSDWINFTNGIIPSTGDFTVEAWAYASSSGSYREILSQGSGGNAFYLGTDGSSIRAGDGWQSTGGTPFPFYGWHHFAVVKTSTNTSLYVDGVLSNTTATVIPNPAASTPFRIGRQYGTYGEYWSGYVDEVRVWNVARSAAQISGNYSSRLTGGESGLAGYWRFDEGKGSAVGDSSAGGNTGTLQGTPVWVPGGLTNLQSANILSQYVLNLDLLDTAGPAISSVDLPGAGTTNYGILDRFSLYFNRDISAAVNARNRDIRVYNGHAYTLTTSAMSWYDAELQARALGGHLATINDAVENAWVTNSFGSDLWIGLTDELQRGTYLWSSGDSLAYTNWDSSQPNNANNADYVVLRTNGKWTDYPNNTSRYGLIEVVGTDSDGDGIPDTLDPYPNDPYNGFDLRCAGADGAFDTSDDQTYHFTHTSYTSGTSMDFYVSDGPLQPGYYRFTVTSSFKDLFGSSLATPFVQYFTVSNVAGYVLEGRTNNTPATATALPLTEDPPLVKSAAGRGNLSSSSDADYWKFQGSAGDRLNLAVYVPGSPSGSQLYYRVLNPDGTTLVSYYPSYYGEGETAGYVLPTNGTYTVLVTYYYSYWGEYRFRLTLATPPVQMESEANGTIATATALSFTVDTNGASGSIAGRIRVTGDLDYINLGTVTNGSSIFLNVRTPASSSLSPIVSVYNSAGIYQPEATGGRPADAVANVPITVTGTYYALVRAGGSGAGDMNQQYVLDVNVVPTGSVNFPNLIVSSVTPPTGSSILSGQNIVYGYQVQNVGSTATAVGNWVDRAVLSVDSTLGNGDDISLGFFPHAGTLNAGDSYSVTNLFALPDGISGDYYVIVQTDSGNAVNEYLFKGDNITVSSNTFHVNVAPYPDLVVEGLNVSGPDSSATYTISWNTANRGTATAPSGFYERYIVRNLTAGTLLTNLETQVASPLLSNGVLPHLQTLTVTNAGVYQVQVITDSRDGVYEYNTNGHAMAEANNTATNGFSIIAYFNVSVQSSPAGAGLLTGGGSYTSGATATVTATPVTNLMPYLFVNWTEGGSFQSASTNYPFIVTRDRTLVANFTLPSYLVAASNNPPSAGVVAGQGNYFYGVTNVLTATPGSGYRFTNWTENGAVISTSPLLTNIVSSNRFVVANYAEANTLHWVTTATLPTNVAAVSGAGTYTNGQQATLSAPASVTNPPNIYNFKQFQLSGASVSASPSFNKTFSTLDATNLQYLAVYDTLSILPLVTNVSRNLAGVVPATTNFVLSFQFNRSMNTNFTPVVTLTNPVLVAQTAVPTGGVWTASIVSNDTFSTAPITFSSGMDGTNYAWIKLARDMSGSILALTNPASFVVDVTPPANPVIAVTSSNTSSATVSWSGYAAPSDLYSFRVFIATTNFSSVGSLTAISSLGSSARSYTYYGLSLDRPYYAAITAVDSAGNSSTAVTPLAFTLPSTVPPPVTVQVASVGAASALVSWPSYSTSSLLGFAGFRLYYETSNFTSIAALTAKQTLSSGASSVQVDSLDRTKTYYFAVVGYNVNGATNPSVTTASWSDPYAGQIASSRTLGGAGQSTVDILRSITVVSNAVLTIPAGTTLRFALGTGLTVQQGSLVANGTALDPIVFTSANDQSGFVAAAGDWNGVALGANAGSSVLRNVFVKYGAGLAVTNCSPVVDAFTAQFNTPAGLTVAGSAAISTTNALLSGNDIGAVQYGTAQLSVYSSVIKNNGTNAQAAGSSALVAAQDWWGSASASDITAGLRGTVTHTGDLTGEPLLTPAVGTVSNVVQVGSQSVNLRLACRTADTMRLSEDSTFTSVFFSSFTNLSAFPLSSGGGLKTVFAQFRSVTGQTSTPVSVSVTYITTGPTISSFNLSEGQTLSRPAVVTGAATAPLGMAAMEFYVDGVGVATNAGGSFSFWWDVRTVSSAIHRVKLVARDTSGNLATRELNVVIAPTPPPAPAITTPSVDLAINTNGLNVFGSAEPYVQVNLFRSGSLAGTTNAAADGSYAFRNLTLSEGANVLVAQASDSLGTANSASRSVTLDTIAPAQLILDAPVYQPGVGLAMTWHFPATGKRATTFQVLWNTTPVASAAAASGRTLVLPNTSTTLQGLATTNYYFYVIGFDSLGNQSPLSAPVLFAYDAVPPSFTLGFDHPSPVGVGPLHIILSASEPLSSLPTLTVQPYGSTPSLLALTNTALKTYEGNINVTTLLPSGQLQFRVTGADLASNSFSGAPAGPAMVVDVTPPSGYVSVSLPPPIQATNSTNITVSLQLTELPQTGTTPVLSFTPPIGSDVAITLSGSGTNWSGPLTLTPAMGSGNGHFTLSVSDSLGNLGHSILSGSALEIYNTALPSAPGQPVHFEAAAAAKGKINLTWGAVDGAEIYRVYSEPGSTFTVPTFLEADNITSNQYTDLPSADGSYRYVVTASRRGSEGPVSIVRVVTSDRTPPPTPTNVAAQLAASGLQITWQAGVGAAPDHYNVYRNGTLIRTVYSVTPVIDNPPRGVMSYTVGAVDSLGNEALSPAVSFQMLVGAVSQLQAVVVSGQAPALTWTSTDGTAVGFNVYRNGIKQNSQIVSNANFTDSLPVGGDAVVYAVTAVNSTNAESAARSITLYPVDISLLVNTSDGSSSSSPISSYFDSYQLGVSNLAASASFPLDHVVVQRTIPGGTPMSLSFSATQTVGAGGSYSNSVAVPSAVDSGSQTVVLSAVQQSDVAGGAVTYRKTYTLGAAQAPGSTVEVSVNAPPLAGGLTPFNVKVYNRGLTPIYLATARGSGAQPGDLYISVKNPQGQEVSRTQYTGTPSGVIFYGDVGYMMIPAGGNTTFTVPNVLAPDALASNVVTFQAVVSFIYDRGSASGQQLSGPLSGSMQSSLTLTPYYGTAQTDKTLYSNNDPVIISGQAISRASGLPLPNTALKIGFASRGYRWYNDVTTDSNGNYSYTFNVTPGLAGTISIWAAHPQVYDQLNQASATIYRIYCTPQSGDVRMSKNDTLPFTISVYNPGDQPLTGFGLSFQAYQMSGTNQIALSTVHGSILSGSNFNVGAGQRQNITLQLAADANAPSNATTVFTLQSAEGASANFVGYVTFTPAVPVLAVTDPDMGYVDVSLNRGTLLSRQVTVMNRGLKDLQGVTIQPPTNVTWMSLNLAVSSNGLIMLPDIPVGGSNTFTVVFAPPTNTALGYFQDKMTIAGTNASLTFDVNLYARVTSVNKGAVQFYVDDILGLDVPNANIRLRNLDLQVELPAVQTDINGLVTVTNLQEGNWSWQVGAAGHSGNVGVVTVVADQTVNVSTRLNKSVVTVNFTVVPVPYTDRYEIQLEQTFETHVPLPVLVMTPSFKQFDNVTPGFQATYIVTVKNEGLIQMENLRITGQTTAASSYTPLITYVPVLLPQQTIEVPFAVTYQGTNGVAQQDGNPLLDCLPDPSSIGSDIPAFIDGLRAIANAEGRCIKDNTLLAIAGGVAIGMKLYQDITGLFASIPEQIASYIGCVIGSLLARGMDSGTGSGNGQGSMQEFSPTGGGCFAAETRVLLDDGRLKRIDEIRVGDNVRCGAGRGENAAVADIYHFQVESCRKVTFSVGSATEDIITTDEHLFWVDGAGWTAAAKLHVGDWLLTSDGRRAQVRSSIVSRDAREVFTLKLAGDTAFYANGVRVHDLCGTQAPPGVARHEWPPTGSAASAVRLNHSK